VDEAGGVRRGTADDEMIRLRRGECVPAEVEDLLSQAQAVRGGAVIGVDDEKFGQRLKAFVGHQGRRKLSEDDVKKYVKAKLARFKVRGRSSSWNELPRNAGQGPQARVS